MGPKLKLAKKQHSLAGGEKGVGGWRSVLCGVDSVRVLSVFT